MGDELVVRGYEPGRVDRKELNHVPLKVPHEDLAFLVEVAMTLRVLVVSAVALLDTLSSWRY